MRYFELLLTEFDEVLRKYNLVNYERLYPPVSELDLEIILTELKVKSEDFKTLYQWKNGFDFTKDSFTCFNILFHGTLL